MKSTTTRNASLVVTARCESIAKIAYVFSCALGVECEMGSSSSFMSARTPAALRIQDHHPAFSPG
jgi:hypothetical protein